MNALPRHTHACRKLLTILILATAPAAVFASELQQPVTRPPVEPSDSRRAEPGDLERLIPDAAVNPQASPLLQVEGNPVLTDRGFVHIPAAAFSPASLHLGAPTFFTTYSFDPFQGFAGGGSSTQCAPVTAAVHLPEGVTVGLVALTAIDNAREALELRLVRHAAFAELDAFEMAYIETDGFSEGIGLWLDDSINEPVIQNGFYQYELTACVNDLKLLRSVFIYYTP